MIHWFKGGGCGYSGIRSRPAMACGSTPIARSQIAVEHDRVFILNACPAALASVRSILGHL
jgi:hypothetical protein